MEQCTECNNSAVLWGMCEVHLTKRERAVLRLVRAVEATNMWADTTNEVRRAVAVVKEGG